MSWEWYPVEISCKNSLNQKNHLKSKKCNWCRESGWNNKNFYWGAKGGYNVRAYVRNNRPIPNILYQDRMIHQWNGGSASTRKWLSEGKNGRGTVNVQCKIRIWYIPGRTVPMPNLFNLKSNGVAIGKVKTQLSGIRIFSKVVNWEVQKLFMGGIICGTIWV